MRLVQMTRQMTLGSRGRGRKVGSRFRLRGLSGRLSFQYSFVK